MKLDTGKIEFHKKSLIIDVLLYMYVVSIYIFSYRDKYNMISNATMVLVCGAVLYYMLFKFGGGRVYFDKTLGIYSIFVGICMVSVTYAEYRGLAIGRVRTLVLIWLMMFILYNYLVNTKNDKVLIYAIMVGGLLSSAYVISFYGISGYRNLLLEGERVGTEIANVNTIGMISATTFSLCFYMALFKRKYYLYLISILPLITAFGTGSRKSLVSVVLSAVMILGLKLKRDKNFTSFIKICMLAAVLVAVFVYMLSLPAFETIGTRFEGFVNGVTGEGKTESSAVKREHMITYGLKEFKNHMVLGHGIANSNIVTQKYMGLSTYLHNNYVELLFCVGIVGFAAYYAMFVYLLKRLYILLKRKVEYSEILIIMLLIRLVMDYGAVTYYSKETYILALAVLVFIKLNELKDREKVTENDKICESN